VSTDSTGPKISSRAMRLDVCTLVKIVGAYQNPFSGITHGRAPAVGALGHADVAQRADALELLLRVDRADVGVLVERVAEAQRRQALLQALDDLVVDVLLHEQRGARRSTRGPG
jgi:hypothetical protein